MWDLDQFRDNIAIVNEYKEKMTYQELAIEANKIAKVINERCLVFSLCRNEIGSILGYVSFINHRIVPVLLNSHLENELLESLINLYSPSYLWIPEDMKDNFPNFNVIYETYKYALVKTDFEKKYELYDELCLLLTTSGSTGSPKLVRQSYKNVLSNTKSIVEYLNLDESEKAITTLPMNYTYGLSIINTHLFAGATLLVTDKGLMQKEFWTLFKEEGATSFGGVPYTYEILDKLRFARMKLSTLRYCTQAGGKLTPELHKKFAEDAIARNTKFIVMYGQCEATARMGYLPSEKSLEKYGSMGVAIPGGSFSLIDDSGNEIIEPEQSGELVYKGDNVTLGYAETGDDLAKGDERNGILHTGDMAKFDSDGFYYIVGRKKRFLKIFGNRVNLDEIDRLVKAKFDNVEFASSGVDDLMYLFVTDEKLSDEIKDFVVFKTGLNKSAFKTIIIDEIPKNDSGKVLYRELNKYFN